MNNKIKTSYKPLQPNILSSKSPNQKPVIAMWALTIGAIAFSIIISALNPTLNFSLLVIGSVMSIILPAVITPEIQKVAVHENAISNISDKYDTSKLSDFRFSRQPNTLSALYFDKDNGNRISIKFAFDPETNEPFLLNENNTLNYSEIERNISKTSESLERV